MLKWPKNAVICCDANGVLSVAPGIVSGDQTQHWALEPVDDPRPDPLAEALASATDIGYSAASGRRVDGKQSVMGQFDKDGDSQIDLDEFVATGGTEEEFKQYDADGDGYVDSTELAAAAEEAAEKKSEEKAESVFEAIDKNKDGKLTQEEFAAWAENNPKEAEEFFCFVAKSNFKDGNDDVPFKEKVGVFWLKALVEEDKNVDTKLDKDEFCTLYKKMHSRADPDAAPAEEPPSPREIAKQAFRDCDSGNEFVPKKQLVRALTKLAEEHPELEEFAAKVGEMDDIIIDMEDYDLLAETLLGEAAEGGDAAPAEGEDAAPAEAEDETK